MILQAKPRIVTDNGPQFITRDFKSFVQIHGLTHVKTAPYYRSGQTSRGRELADVTGD